MKELVAKSAVFLSALVIIGCAWYGAEMLLYGSSQTSAVDMLAALVFSWQIMEHYTFMIFEEEDEEE